MSEPVPFTYWGVHLVSEDAALRSRISACAAKEGLSEPEAFAFEHRWDYASAPGWADAYEYALATGNPAPGQDPTVITDGQILSQVQAMIEADRPSLPGPG